MDAAGAWVLSDLSVRGRVHASICSSVRPEATRIALWRSVADQRTVRRLIALVRVRHRLS